MFKIVKNLFFFFVIPVLETIVIFSRCAWWSKLRVTILKRFYNSAPPHPSLGEGAVSSWKLRTCAAG